MMDIRYECIVCQQVVEDAVPAEDSRGNLTFICYPCYLNLDWQYTNDNSDN